MFLSEPAPSPSDFHFQLGEFPVRIHPTFWLTTIILGPIQQEPSRLIMWVPAVIVSIIVHELGHALAFRFYGIGSSIVLYSMGGLAVPRGSQRRNEPLHPTEQIVISLAGPFAGFALGGAIYFLMQLANYQDVGLGKYLLLEVVFPPSKLAIFIYYMLYINIFWGLINLLPIYPLDGGQVSQQLFLMFSPHDPIRQSLVLSIAVAIGMIFVMASRSHSITEALFSVYLFGMLAWQNYMILQSYSSRGPWN